MTIPELLEQIRFARFYTLRLLDRTPEDYWFRVPTGGVTFVGWQVGHLAMAGYRLALERVRGRRPGDEELLPDEVLTLFGRDSVPVPHPETGRRFTAAELRSAYERVHARIQGELPGVAEADLDLPPEKPHMICTTRRACVLWCAQHELVHAGQIGLLRRQLGHAPVW
jgi:hypothetical protein